MSEALLQLGLFSAKTLIIFIFIVLVLAVFFILAAKGKEKLKGHLTIKNLNEKFASNREMLLTETLTKKEFKTFLKDQKAKDKAREKDKIKKNVFVINFDGDIKASAVSSLSEEITALLSVAKPSDEVVVKIESPGGMVSGYGLAAAQLMRIRAHRIPLTVTIDKVAASGGYLMACVANKILSSPFAVVGSIGVIVQLPNFHRFLKHNHIDFEQHTAGKYKRTISVFGENTETGRKKLQGEIEDIQSLFTQTISEYRKQVDIDKVATGEFWLGNKALELNLVDEIKTSDDYLLERSKHATVYEIAYQVKKPLLTRLTQTASILKEKLFRPVFIA